MNVITDGLWVTSPGDADFSKSPTAVEYSKYNSLASPDHIRLLRILPGDAEPLCVTLEEVQLDVTQYECLSYTWDGPKYGDNGDEWTTNHKGIACNNVILNIRQNLHDVLLHMRELSMLGPIWIDALCINQEDKQERQDQVGLMSRIYKGASRVIVWLGKEDEYTAPALTHLQRSKATPAAVFEDTGFDTKAYHDAAFTDDEYDSIFCFLAHRRWFSRLWTIQETVLARELVFLCGKHEASLNTIYAGASALRYRNARSGLNPEYEDISEQAEWAVMLFVTANRRHEWQLEGAELESIGANALSFANSRATDARDKVFGLIGISRCTDEDLDEEMVADYDATVQKIYIKAAKFALLSATKLDALSCVQDESAKLIKGLPSWVTDLTADEMDWFESEESYLIAASEGETYTLDFEDNVLVLAASRFDRIVAVGETFDEIQRSGTIVEFLGVFLAMGKGAQEKDGKEGVYGWTGEKVEQVMQRTLIADRMDMDARDEVEIMGGEYDLMHAFECWLFRLVCYALRADPEGSVSDSDSESGSESGDAEDEGGDDEKESESESGSGSDSEDDGVIVGAEDTTTEPENSAFPEKRNPVVALSEEANPELSSSNLISNSKDAETSSAGTNDRAARKATHLAVKSERHALLSTFLSSPITHLASTMALLGFPDPEYYATLTPSILRGAEACNHTIQDYEAIPDELFESMWCGEDQFASSWFYKGRKKVPVRTENGWVGMAGEDVVVGDVVFVIEGAGVLYVLRERVVEDGEEVVEVEDGKMEKDGKKETEKAKAPMAEEINPKERGEKMDVPFTTSPTTSTATSKVPLRPLTTTTTTISESQAKNMPTTPTTTKKASKHKSDDKPKSEAKSKTEEDDDEWDDAADTRSENSESGSFSSSSSSTSSAESYEDGGEYTLGGEVYLHGVMYGEMFEEGWKEKVKGTGMEMGMEEVVFKKVRIF